jgi:uncharacterized protein (TIGR02391 family)
MASSTIAPFGHGSIENIATIIGELYTGPELTRILASLGMPDTVGATATKWKRLAASMGEKQFSQRDGRPILAVIVAAMKPDMIWDRQGKAAVARDELTQVLSMSGYRVLDDGRIGRAKTAATASEASARSVRLRKPLEARDAHPEVIRHCREELLRKDHYEAVFEAVKGLGARLREKSELDEDGRPLVQAALRGKQPRVLLTDCSTVTERNEQEGIALLAEGVFAAFRNPAAHEPRLVWEVSEQDALDVLGTLSMIQRSLDSARSGTRGCIGHAGGTTAPMQKATVGASPWETQGRPPFRRVRTSAAGPYKRHAALIVPTHERADEKPLVTVGARPETHGR